MKKYLLLLSLSVFVFAGCKKKDVCRKCEFYTYTGQNYLSVSHCGTDAEFEAWKKPMEGALIPGYNRMECK